jgi:hypothetical protein
MNQLVSDRINYRPARITYRPDRITYRPSCPKKHKAIDDEFLAFRILQVICVVLPIGAGLDKFLHLITNWDHYVSPLIPLVTHIHPHQMMFLLGPVEIAIGLMVAFKPRIGSIVASAMFAGIVINLLTMPGQLHIAFLDLSLCLTAIVLFILSQDR